MPLDALDAQTELVGDLLIAQPLEPVGQENFSGFGLETGEGALQPIEFVARLELRGRISANERDFVDRDVVRKRALQRRLSSVAEQIGRDRAELGFAGVDRGASGCASADQADKAFVNQISCILPIRAPRKIAQ